VTNLWLALLLKFSDSQLDMRFERDTKNFLLINPMKVAMLISGVPERSCLLIH